MKLVKTQYISREAVKEEIEHTFEVTQGECEDLLRAISIIESYKSQILSKTITLSDWHSVNFVIDSEKLTVNATVKHGMAG